MKRCTTMAADDKRSVLILSSTAIWPARKKTLVLPSWYPLMPLRLMIPSAIALQRNRAQIHRIDMQATTAAAPTH
jgi:hypothetical protein